jgi:hypothetical protein
LFRREDGGKGVLAMLPEDFRRDEREEGLEKIKIL